ncbi:Hsp33 family molecular chaperone HslO [Thiogranum longum]|jgi:molecular chaperone Hsp33
MKFRDNDCLHRFLFEHTNVRGEVLHLDASWQALLERQDYPAPVRALLGQATAAATLLAATIKIDGSLHLQLQGDGPVNLLLVEVTSERTLRGLARWSGDLPDASLGALVGNARLMLTIDPGRGGERYQGVVAVEQDNLAAALEDYFEQSEQLATRLWLAADEQRACGMLLQQLPAANTDDDAWKRDVFLGETVTEAELLQLPVRELLYRLFHEEDVRLFDPEPVSFRCSCSRERIETMLRGLGYDEVQEIIKEQGSVGVNCEFCGQSYSFDAVDVEAMFAAASQPEVPDTRH